MKPIFTFRYATTALGTAKVVAFEIPGGVTTPEEFSGAIAEAKGEFVPPGGSGLVVDGRGPVWAYGMILHEGHPSAWAATRDPRLGMVVVSTHTTSVKTGEVAEFPA